MSKSILHKFFNKEWQEFILFHSNEVSIKANQSLFNVGDETHGLFILNKGKVKVVTNGINNVERIIRLASTNDIIGHRGFGEQWKYPIAAIALVDSNLLFIPKNIFDMAFKANPEFAYFMMIFFADELRQSERDLSQLPIKNIIAGVLYNNLQKFGYADGSQTKLSFTLSRKDIASQAGTRYETVIRMLTELNNDKIIKIERKSIHILDENALFEFKEGIRIN